MLTGFRSTPHPATEATPYEAMMNRPIRTKLDHQARAKTSNSSNDTTVKRKDEEYKDRMTCDSYNGSTKEHNFIVRDHVLLKQKKTNKWSTMYEPAFNVTTRAGRQGSKMVE